MTTRCRVSAIVTAHNSERFLAEAINSVLCQTAPVWELLVIDDGSTDATGAVTGRFADRVRLLRLEDVGPPAARNRGVLETRGDLIAFLDADDLWFPTKIHRQVATIEPQPEIGYSVTHAKLFWSNELSAEAEAFRDHQRARPVPGFAASTWLVRRTVFNQVGPLREDLYFGDVVEWFARADRLGVPKAILPDVLVSRRMHTANLTRRRRQDGRAFLLDFLKSELDLRRSSRQPAPRANIGTGP